MRSFLPAFMISTSLAACGGTGANVDAEGCKSLADGPFTAVTASAAMDATAPAITTAAGAFTVTLPPSGRGYLSFDSPDDTEYAVFTDRTLMVTAFAPNGTEILPSAHATSTSVCTSVHERDVIELAVASFYIALGPDAGGSFNLVLRPYNPD